MANQRAGVPAGWTWRDGRPRWKASPTLRRAGWKDRDLKDPLGRWLARGASIDAAQAIVDAVAAWRRGETPAAGGLADTGGDALPAPVTPPAAVNALSIGVLIDAYLASDELTTRKDGSPRPAKTLSDYRTKLKRLVDALAGFAVLPAPSGDARADAAAARRYAADTASVRGLSVASLAPVDMGDRVAAPLRDAYIALRKASGVHMAFGVMSVASAWLTWARKHRNTAIRNWAADVERETPRGRIRIASWEEIAALVWAADGPAKRPEVADALILSLALAWSEADVLALTWDRVAQDEAGVWRAFTGQEGRQKTGRIGGTPLLSIAVRRLKAIRERQAAMAAQPLKVIHMRRDRQRGRKAAADGDYFRGLFAEVRALAVGKAASVATLTYADMRDTGDTLGLRAGLNDQQRAGRNLRSLKNNADLTDRHYGEIGPEITAAGHLLLDPYVEGELTKHGVKL